MDFLETLQGVLRIREPSIPALQSALISLVESPTKRHTFGQSNRDYAFSKFNLNAKRENFHNLLTQTSQEKFREFEILTKPKFDLNTLKYFFENRHLKRGMRLLKRIITAKN